MSTTATVNLTETQPVRPGDPCVMVIFGGSGDLTKRKLIPALYNLAKDHFLSGFAVVGIGRRV
jgi:glucose-6-phosphate 1-dehydrogenase